MSQLFQTLSQEMIRAVDDEMRSVLQLGHKSDIPHFYGMIHYHMGWVDEQLAPVQLNSGKRIRPVLTLLTCAAAGGNWEQALPAAAAVEILHNFTLVHDDIQDDSPTRRGRPTVWKIWGIPQAINAGDAMFAAAHLAMARLEDAGVPSKRVVRALRRLDETCTHLTIGQHMDMDFETRDSVSVDTYVKMITGKTAALASLSAELGAIVAGCDEATIQHYAAFGMDLGLAFQIRDDILGIWGDEETIGKSASTDITTRKKTLPALYALERSEGLRTQYQHAPNGDEASYVSRAVAHMEAVGAQQYAETRAESYSNSALAHMEAASPTGDAGVALHQLAQILLHRNA